MTDDTRRILDLLAQGKITVDEAEQLLRAIGTPAPAPAAAAAPDDERQKPKWVRIAVHQIAKEARPGKDARDAKDVNIRVPIAIVKSGMRLGALIPGVVGDQVAARLRERGFDIDFSKLDGAAIDAILKDLGDTNIEIDSGKAQVRITCE